MILTILSSPSASWWFWESLACIAAGLGGVLVFWGLWLEGPPIEDLFLDIEAFRLHKRRAERGWKMLMLGIFIEIVVAVVFAAKDGWQARQTERQIAANDPRNLPLASLTAYVAIEYKTNNVETNIWDHLTLIEKTNDAPFLRLTTSNGDSFVLSAVASSFVSSHLIEHGEGDGKPVDSFMYVRRFDWDATAREFEMGLDAWLGKMHKKTNELNGDAADAINNFTIDGLPFMHKTEIIGGTIELFANGTVRHKIPIPPQSRIEPMPITGQIWTTFVRTNDGSRMTTGWGVPPFTNLVLITTSFIHGTISNGVFYGTGKSEVISN
jgi:hypothetical protein